MYEYHNPYEVFRGVTNSAGYCSEYLVSYLGMSSDNCTVSEASNSDGTYTASISTTDLEILPTKIKFNGLSGLKTVEYIKASNVAEFSFSNNRDITYINATGWNIKQTNLNYVFYDCTGLTEIKGIETWNTSEVTNMSNMFKNCKKLTSLDLSRFDTSKVTNMNDMFNGCSGLTSIDLSGFDTSKVTSMTYMFYACKSLTSLDLSRFDTSEVTSMAYMFSSCNNLTSLDLSGFDTGKVTSMAYMFYACSGLTSLDLSMFDTSEVIYMANMFNGCSKLTSLDLSGFNTSNVTNMSSMFEKCSSLTNLDSMQNISVSLDLSDTILDVTSLLDVIDNLTTVTTTQTLTLGSTLLAKLTEDQIAIATNKGWTVV